MNQLKLQRGRFITDSDLTERRNVCVIAHSVAQQLFPFEDDWKCDSDSARLLCRDRSDRRTSAQSAGIGGSLAAQNYNLDIYIPLETLRWRIGDQIMTSRSGSREAEVVELSQITLKVADTADVDSSAAIAEELLKKHHINQDFAIVVPKELLRQAETMRMLFNVLLILISGISLLVAVSGS